MAWKGRRHAVRGWQASITAEYLWPRSRDDPHPADGPCTAGSTQKDGYRLSIGEVLAQYQDGNLEVHPELRRVFDWNNDQKSALIESLLLGIPVPPIVVYLRRDGIWDVIDGLRRLSAILQFVGVYRDEAGDLAEPLTLSATEYLPDLAGYRWHDGSPTHRAFSDAMRRDFKRSRLEFRIVRKALDEGARYDMYCRLNVGRHTSEQEARDGLLLMLNRSMHAEITRLSNSTDFRAACQACGQETGQAYHRDLVLRFFCQADSGAEGPVLPRDAGQYLTAWTRAAAKVFDTPASKIDSALFERTFRLLADSLGEDAFRRWDGGPHVGPFSASCFEFVTSGLCANLGVWESRSRTDLAERVRAVWSAPAFCGTSADGGSPPPRLARLVPHARDHSGR